MIDLHVHSVFSDGSDTPTQIIKKAQKIKLQGIALTDHDCIEGLEEAEREAIKLGVPFYNGIELSTSFGENRLLHILGINYDRKNTEFLNKYYAYRKRREGTLPQLFDALAKKGVTVNVNELYNYTDCKYIDRLCVVKWLVDHEYAESLYHAWVNYVDTIPYAKGELLEPEEAFEMIKAGGGKSYLAHFQKYIGFEGYNKELRYKFLKELQNVGLDGIEAYYPSFTKQEEAEVNEYVRNLGLISSGGTDYHGLYRLNNELGIGDGSFMVPDKLVEDF